MDTGHYHESGPKSTWRGWYDPPLNPIGIVANPGVTRET